MELTVDTTYLKDAARWAALALPARGAEVPVYAAMRLTADEDGLTLAAFNGEEAAACTVPARVAEPGTVLLPGLLLSSLVAKMPPGQPLTFTAAPGDGRVQVKGSAPKLNGTFDLEVFPGDNAPMLPELPPVAGVADGTAFAAAAGSAAGVVARDSGGVPAEGCRGLRLEPGPETLTIVGSNGYLLGMRSIPWSRTAEGVPPLLLPSRIVAAAAKAIPAGSKVTLHAGPGDEADPRGMAGLSCDGRTLSARALTGAFPNYRKMLRTAPPFTASMDAGALSDAVERAELMMGRGSGVRVTLYGTEAMIEAEGGPNGGPNGASETIEAACAAPGEPVTIIMNPEYLRRAVQGSDPDRVEIGLTPPFSAVRITAAGNATVTDCDCYLLQPLKRGEPAR